MGQTPSWGIEISVGLRSPNAPPPVASAVPMSIKMEPTHSSRSMATSDISSHVRGVMSSPVPPSLPSSSAFSGVSRQPAPSLPHRAPSRPPVNHHSASIPAHPLSPSRVVSVTPHTKARDAVKHSASRKRKNTVEPSHTQSRTRRTTARKSSRGKGNASSSESDGFPDNISARLYNNPESLTKEQAERLLESPAFLSMLSKLTGQPIVANNGVSVKREREDNVDESEEAKRRRISSEGRASLSAKKEDDSVAPTPKCWNCGRTKSAVWRMKVMDDGNSVRVCNGELSWSAMTDLSVRFVLEQDASHATTKTLGRRRRGCPNSETKWRCRTSRFSHRPTSCVELIARRVQTDLVSCSKPRRETYRRHEACRAPSIHLETEFQADTPNFTCTGIYLAHCGQGQIGGAECQVE